MDDIINKKPAGQLSVMTWNIHGLGEKLTLPHIQNLLSKYDIIILSEIWKNAGFKPDFAGFKYVQITRSHKHPNARRQSGGIGILISKAIQKGVNIKRVMDFFVWIHLDAKFFGMARDISLGAVYIPPEGSSYSPVNNNYFEIICDEIGARELKNHEVVLCGDFNARTGKNKADRQVLDSQATEGPIIEERFSADTVTNANGKELLNLCISCNLYIMNGRLGLPTNSGNFTCITANGQSAVDYLICRDTSLRIMKNMELLQLLPESDHTPLSFQMNCTKPLQSHRPSNSSTYNSYRWRREDREAYQENINSDPCKNLKDNIITLSGDQSADVDTIVDVYYNYMDVASVKAKRARGGCGSTFPRNTWYNDECKQARRKLINYSRTHDLNLELNRAKYFKLKQDYRKVLQRTKRKAKDKKNHELDGMLEHKNSKTFWRAWKLIHSTKNSVSVSISEFLAYFQLQSVPPHIDYFEYHTMEEITKFINENEHNYRDNPFDELLEMLIDSPIKITETQLALSQLKLNRAAGSDGIPSEFLEYGGRDIVDILYILFNYIWERGEFPKTWAEGIINPLHKKGDVNTPDNYRKVTIMNSTCKVFEIVLNNRFKFKNEMMCQDDPLQTGFVQNGRTSDNIFILHTAISIAIDDKRPLYCCFIDFTKDSH